jgi:hypothetical protein
MLLNIPSTPTTTRASSKGKAPLIGDIHIKEAGDDVPAVSFGCSCVRALIPVGLFRAQVLFGGEGLRRTRELLALLPCCHFVWPPATIAFLRCLVAKLLAYVLLGLTLALGARIPLDCSGHAVSGVASVGNLGQVSGGSNGREQQRGQLLVAPSRSPLFESWPRKRRDEFEVFLHEF